VRTLGKIAAIAGFSLIVGPALLAINGLLDNPTLTILFILGLVLIFVSSSNRGRSSGGTGKASLRLVRRDLPADRAGSKDLPAVA